MVIYCDGGSANDRGISSRAYYSIRKGSDEVEVHDTLATSNEAEWKGLICALFNLIGTHEPAIVRMDSELVYRQMLGTYKVRSSRLAELHAIASRLLHVLGESHTPTTLELVPREENQAHVVMAEPLPTNGLEDILKYLGILESFITGESNMSLRNEWETE